MELPKINQKIEFKVLHGPFAAAYSTYVEDIEERAVVVVQPTVGGNPVGLQPGDPVRVEYAITGSARIAFTSRVIGLDVRVLPVVLVALPEREQIERFQTRDFVRIEAQLSVIYKVLSIPGEPVRQRDLQQTITRDISGNGAQILCHEPFPQGTQLVLHLNVMGRQIHVVAEVIREVQRLNAKDTWLGVRFVGMEERDRDHIIRFIFNEQRERRRKGLL